MRVEGKKGKVSYSNVHNMGMLLFHENVVGFIRKIWRELIIVPTYFCSQEQFYCVTILRRFEHLDFSYLLGIGIFKQLKYGCKIIKFYECVIIDRCCFWVLVKT